MRKKGLTVYGVEKNLCKAIFNGYQKTQVKKGYFLIKKVD